MAKIVFIVSLFFLSGLAHGQIVGDGIEIDDSKGWHALPPWFANYLKIEDPNIPFMDYKGDSRFLRTIRISRGTYSRTIKSWDHFQLLPETPEDVTYCWYVFLTGGNCHRPKPVALPEEIVDGSELDLLKLARRVSKSHGLRVARDVVAEELLLKDSSAGRMRERFIKTTADTSIEFPDSVANIPAEERKDIGIYFALGIGGQGGRNAVLFTQAAERVGEMGFTTEMLDISRTLGSKHNAGQLEKILADRLPKINTAVFVAASKGVADFITFFLNNSESISPADRAKVRLMVSISGVTRDAIMAKFISKTKRLDTFAIRQWIKLSGEGEKLEGIKSLAEDPWNGHDPAKVKALYPNIKWLSMPAVPEGPEGITHLDVTARFLINPLINWANEMSPFDGLVETAASVLPPKTGIEEFIVPLWGSHSPSLSSYKDGLSVAPNAMAKAKNRNQIIPEAGPEMMSAIFRALPASLLK